MSEENKKFGTIQDFHTSQYAGLGFENAVVTWFMNAVKPSKRSRRHIALGLCSYGKGVAFIAMYNPNKPITMEFLRTMMVKDVFIDVKRKTCGDAKWCLNLKCPLNKAEIKHFRKYGLKNKKELQVMHNLFENIKRDLKLENKEVNIQVYFKKPPVYLCTRRR